MLNKNIRDDKEPSKSKFQYTDKLTEIEKWQC
jgi:hypothetical protein